MTQTEQHLSDALRDLVAAQPFEPDRAAIVHRGLRLRRRAKVVRGLVGAGVVAVVTAVTVGVVGLSGSTAAPQHVAATPPAHAKTGAKPVAQSPSQQLVGLADYIVANAPQQTGDATLSLGVQSYSSGLVVPRADLFADNGKYYYARTRSGLPAQVKGDHTEGNGVFAREVAAAIYAVNGDLGVARQKMTDAPLDPGTQRRVPVDWNSPAEQSFIDNWVWGDSMDALTVGAGNPQVRAGVLRLLSTVREVTVTHTTTDGQATLTLTVVPPALPGNQTETLVINAGTGIPIKMVGGQVGQAPDRTITYQISRVTLADIAAGKF